MCEFSVIIVTYNSERDIARCVESIIRLPSATEVEIVVVDNNSSDNTCLSLQDIDFPRLKVIRSSQNLGFSKGCNLGAAAARGRFLYFCNPDSVIVNDIFTAVKPHLSTREAGCVSPQILRNDGSEAAFAFKFPHPPLALLKAFFRNLVGASDPYVLQINLSTDSTVIECDWVLGAGMFIRRDVFGEVGGFDQSYFLYFEDVDICKKIGELGYKVIADRSLSIRHRYFGSSMSLPKSEVMAIRIKSQLVYYRKHHGIVGYLLAKYLDHDGFIFRA